MTKDELNTKVAEVLNNYNAAIADETTLENVRNDVLKLLHDTVFSYVVNVKLVNVVELHVTGTVQLEENTEPEDFDVSIKPITVFL